MSWAIVVHDEAYMGDFLRSLLADQLPGINVLAVKNFADVRIDDLERYGLGECRLMVLSFSAPSHPSDPPPIEGNRSGAIAFINEIRRTRPTIPCIFLTRVVDTSSQQLCAALENVRLLGIQNINRTLPTAVSELVFNVRQGAQKLPHDVDVDITLLLGGPCTWGMFGSGGSALEDAGAFDIEERQLRELIEYSEDATTRGNPNMIKQVGRKMYETLFADSLVSAGFEIALRQNINIKDDTYLEAARFRFHLDSRTNTLLVETLAKPKSRRNSEEMQFWMLSAPIYRKYGSRGERKPLFKDRVTRNEAIDCLVIQGSADAFSAAAPVSSDFNAITLAKKEVGWLEKYWHDHETDFRLGHVKVMRPEDYPDKSYGEEVRKALGERKWHLIHYAGHSSIVGEQGYLVLGDGKKDLLDIDTFARDARSAQFVFLNSCSSAKGIFVTKLVEKNIPAVVGYAWPVSDRPALKFSRQFYTELFEGQLSQRFLEYSFMRSKAHLFHNDEDKSAWAAPLLFMQTSHADRD